MTRSRWADLGELALYPVCALLAVRSAWGLSVDGSPDLIGAYWFQEWTAHCLRERVNPLWTDWFFHPAGKDILAHTGANFVDTLVAMPLYLLLGMPDYYAPTAALIITGNALAMRALLRVVVKSRAAVVAGSLLFALHPFVLHEIGDGRLAQSLLWFWPLALRELLRMDEDRRWFRPVLAGLAVAAQAYTYWFTGHLFALVFGPLLLLWGRDKDRGWWLRLGIAGAVSLAAVVPVAVPMMMFAADGAVPLVGDAAQPDIVLFMRLEDRALFSGARQVVPWRAAALAVVGLIAMKRRGPWLAGAAVGALMLVGPRFGASADAPPNPAWWLADLLPGFVRMLFPTRFWAALAVIGSVAVAVSLHTRIRWPAVRVVGAVIAVLVGMAPLRGGTGMLKAVPFEVPVYVDAVQDTPGIVLDLPLFCAHPYVHFQALHGQPMIGGMGDRWSHLRPPGIEEGVREDPVLATLVDASRGLPAKPPPRKERSHVPRWIVLHTDVYGSWDGETCWFGDPSVEPSHRGNWVRNQFVRILGEPTVADATSLAWELEPTPVPRGRLP